MISINSSEVTDVKIQNQNDSSTSEVIPTNNVQNPSTSTIAKVDEKTVFTLWEKNSIVNTLIIGDLGTLEIQAELKNNTYGITLLPTRAEHHFDKLMGILTNIENAQRPKHRPNVGDLICGQKMNEDWVRGYIVSQLPYLKVAVIDEAVMATINNITACDKISSDFCAFGALCEVTDSGHKFEEGDVYEFKVTGQTNNKEQGGYEILILSGKVKAIVKPWIPTPEQIGVQCAEVDNETEVIITGYQNHIHLYVRPINTVGLEYYDHIMQLVAQCAETCMQYAPFLKEPPAIGDIVIAQSADKNYYRAFVTRVEDGNITILYLDVGKKEVTDMKKLKILPDDLKEVILRDVPRDIPLMEEIDDFLTCMVTGEVPLLCTYDGVPSLDGVYLKFPDGDTLNNMICKFIKPKGAAE